MYAKLLLASESLSENVLAWSGMQYEHKLWVVITPSKPGHKTTLHFTTTRMATTACDLVGGTVIQLTEATEMVKFEQKLRACI